MFMCTFRVSQKSAVIFKNYKDYQFTQGLFQTARYSNTEFGLKLGIYENMLEQSIYLKTYFWDTLHRL